MRRVLALVVVRPAVRRGLASHRWRGPRRHFVPRVFEAGDVDGDDVVQAPSPRKFVSEPFSYHQELTLQIEDVTNLGVGVGRVQLAAPRSGSWVVMVPLVLPGETVRVRVFRNHATYSEADVVEIVTKSPDRVQPECAFFEICGGCQYQMMSVDAQRHWKRAQVESLLLRLGGVAEPVVDPVVGTEHTYGYRSKITPHYNVPRKDGKDLKIGFQQRGTRIIVDVDRCAIATPAINVEYSKARGEIQTQMAKKLPKKGATLLFREGEGGHVETDFRKNMFESVNGVRFEYKAGEFFQNNAHVLPLLVDHVLSLCTQSPSSSSSSSSKPLRYLIDAYCGSGLFSLCAAKNFEAVYGVEVSDLAVKAAQANAKANGISNAQFLCGSSEAIFAQVANLVPGDEAAMILDPPRKGCDREFLQQLFAFGPKVVVYVSCDPATQARDAKIMTQEGGYRITRVTPFDLFPQTRHIENVMAFVRD